MEPLSSPIRAARSARHGFNIEEEDEEVAAVVEKEEEEPEEEEIVLPPPRKRMRPTMQMSRFMQSMHGSGGRSRGFHYARKSVLCWHGGWEGGIAQTDA